MASVKIACSEMDLDMVSVENECSKTDLGMASIENRCSENVLVGMLAAGGGSTVCVAELLGLELVWLHGQTQNGTTRTTGIM